MAFVDTPLKWWGGGGSPDPLVSSPRSNTANRTGSQTIALIKPGVTPATTGPSQFRGFGGIEHDIVFEEASAQDHRTIKLGKAHQQSASFTYISLSLTRTLCACSIMVPLTLWVSPPNAQEQQKSQSPENIQCVGYPTPENGQDLSDTSASFRPHSLF